jgi:prepilin-type N-terminal cleavage/methylation domain-containing protein/prepilin-type processing-associated H-X9-DG protein
MSRRKGFTLIELLVVISIIALLVSVLMPALNKAKQSAYAAICKQNLHQWGFIWKFYVDEQVDGGEKKKGFFGDRGASNDWPLSIKDYYWADESPETLRGMLKCRAATKTEAEGGRNPYRAWGPHDMTDEWPVIGSYVINLWISESAGGAQFKTDSSGRRCSYWRTPYIRHASYAPIIVCAQWKDCEPYPVDEPPEHPFDWWEANANELKRPCLQRHGDFVNGLFMDWSVRRIGLKQLWELWWYREWGTHLEEDGRPIWPAWMAHMKDYY